MIYKWLKWVTNNEDISRHEVEFDITFFFVNTIALIVGAYVLYVTHELKWLAFLIIEYSWAFDNMRHNRP